MDVFDNCNISDPTSRKIYFDEESKEYANAVFEDVLENSLAKSNPDIESPENDREYFLRRIVGYQIQEKEIKTPAEELSKTHQKGEEKIKENQKENTIKKGLPKTIEELVEIARKEKENDDINNPGNGQNPNPGSNGPGSSNGEPDR